MLCLLSDENCPLLGLVNFVMPLRTSNVPFNQLKDLVILGDPNYLEKEWASICTFPKIYVFPVSWCIMSFLIGERDIFDAYETILYKLHIIESTSLICIFHIRIHHKRSQFMIYHDFTSSGFIVIDHDVSPKHNRRFPLKTHPSWGPFQLIVYHGIIATVG